MKSRSKKYYQIRKEQSGSKKGSVTEAGYNEENELTTKSPKKNPAPPKSQDDPSEDALATQDDTGGENNSGKRIDNN
ncbi:MAG TPA: hypothetical protein VGP55_14075 [Chitinophagaceae bacterium]|nr:hypothetical protein [Chitinophagaceae bacterium]